MSFFPQARAIPKKFLEAQPFSVSNQEHRFTVPDGKLWLVMAFGYQPGDSSTMVVTKYSADGQLLGRLASWGAGTVGYFGPVQTANYQQYIPIFLWEGQYIRFYFGSAQTSLASLVYIDVVEYDLEEVLRKKK